jgi:RHS repeat-associated protein
MATNGGTLTVMGTTTSAATNVTVNGSNALTYGDATFAATNMPLTTTYTAVAQDSYGRQATNSVSVNLATNTTFQYDSNGNLISDGLRSFAYDDENELIQVLVTNQWLSQFSYDGKMRRRIRQEFTWQSGAWVQTNAVYYVYDGNLVIQERDIKNLPTTTYTRGKDLSGSLEGAGGIGGLLSRTAQSYVDAPLAGHSFYHCDANGNITMLINSEQAVVGQYLYDAFGNMLSQSGLLANANLYRFSSKEAHLNSELVYYLYRYYDPNLQRWPNRDPMGEIGFQKLQKLSIGMDEGDFNLYRFVNNDGINGIDPLGMNRWVFYGPHSYLVYPIWDKCCTRILLYYRVDFSGWGSLFTLGLVGPGHVSAFQVPGPPSGGNLIQSSCHADQALEHWVDGKVRNPPLYSLYSFNCNWFIAIAENIGLEQQ